MIVALPEAAPTERQAEPVYPELLGVADLLREQGWAQHDLVRLDDEGNLMGYCVYGAYLSCKFGHLREYVDDRTTTANELARKLGFKNIGGLTLWNDAEGRTTDEVIEHLERAAYGL